ncbi:hypothetical protein [Adhaeribacter pallidiroseus]|uniref:Uncharacterized protein n=1 Tax=Adhaeribacter pallidiroseus TaxID=2072847 RepID=A0A369QHA3_9BACT|nr:hypothetical protein [Adhaeribacter pallidiroseus]RDC64281.1 hypothetical protein AHMF7616_02894 [Adhaeribacter pallidiroseus]
MAFLLSVLVLLLATIPCCLADNCLNEKPASDKTKKDKDAGPEAEGGLCSPFFQCQSCHTLAFTPPMSRVVMLFFPEASCYPVYSPTFFYQFLSTIWQPPKIA